MPPLPAAPLSRRELIRRAIIYAGMATPAAGLLSCSNSAPEAPGAAPGSGVRPLREEPDANGLLLPAGFESRVIAQASMPAGAGSLVMPTVYFPDGAHAFVDPEIAGGWILVVNSEVPATLDLGFAPQIGDSPPGGGVFAFRFAADGSLTDAYRTLGGSDTNCAGGHTPWGTWISCEEVDGGTSFETHPLGQGIIDGVDYPVRLDNLGIFKHEAAAIDPSSKVIYLTEDQSDGRFYRFVSTDPQPWDGSVHGDLSQGELQVAVVHRDRLGGPLLADTRTLDAQALPRLYVDWVPVPDPQGDPASTRAQVAEATLFNGGEGCWFHQGRVLFTTKGDNRVWDYAVGTQQLNVLYDDDLFPEPVLTGVDNLVVEPVNQQILVAEDGGNLEVVVIAPDGSVAPLLRIADEDPRATEITGLAFSPDRRRFYFSSQRGGDFKIVLPSGAGLPAEGEVGGGKTYEIRREDGLPIFGD